MYEWDERKNQANLEKHGVSFENASRIFDGLVLKNIDERFEYHEVRYKAIGMIEDVALVVIYTLREEKEIRIISARLANKKEREAYYAAVRKATK